MHFLWAEVVFVVFQKGDVYTNFIMPIFCVSLNSITSPSFRCWFIPVSGILKFNQKKKQKMNDNLTHSHG